MSFGKLTLLSADCEGSGAVVGSSVMVADSSGAEAGGCVGGELPRGRAGGCAPAPVCGPPGVCALPAGCAPPTAAGALAAGRIACSAARSVTKAAPKNSTVLNTMSQIDRLFGIAHHSESDCCIRAVRTIAGSQSQVGCDGGLPVGAAD